MVGFTAAAIALATALGMTVEEACEGLAAYQPPPGRTRLLHGTKGSLLIDDSYNASPAAVEEALASLTLAAGQTGHRRIAVLGDMLELGRYSHAEHERIGTLAARHADILATVGVRARGIAEAAKQAGMKEESIYIYANAEEAAEALLPMITEKDAVLVKGSQSIRTERIVAALLENPEDMVHLVRQDVQWKKR